MVQNIANDRFQIGTRSPDRNARGSSRRSSRTRKARRIGQDSRSHLPAFDRDTALQALACRHSVDGHLPPCATLFRRTRTLGDSPPACSNRSCRAALAQCSCPTRQVPRQGNAGVAGERRVFHSPRRCQRPSLPIPMLLQNTKRRRQGKGEWPVRGHVIESTRHTSLTM